MNTRKRLTFANVAATTAVVLAVAGTGGAAYALGKNTVGSKQIKNETVQSKDVRDGSLATGDLAASVVDGLAVAGMKVGSTPTVDQWFNRAGGEPEVVKLDSGLYQFEIPGVSAESAIVNVTSQSGPVDCSVGTFEGSFLVECRNPANVPTDASFHIIAY